MRLRSSIRLLWYSIPIIYIYFYVLVDTCEIENILLQTFILSIEKTVVAEAAGRGSKPVLELNREFYF